MAFAPRASPAAPGPALAPWGTGLSVERDAQEGFGMPADRALFHKFKTRPEGTNAGFILEDGGDLTVLDPTEMRTMSAHPSSACLGTL